MHLHAPQLILLTVMVVGLTVEMVKHGEQKTEARFNFFTSVLADAITIALLWWGGFFRG